MQLIPAIDIAGGRCVRLLRGDFDAVTTYADDPLAPLHDYAALGAPLVHVVDLDGARKGEPVNDQLIARMSRHCAVQTGGGLRNEAHVAAVLECGAARAVIGSAAVRDPALTRRLLDEYGADRIVLALDGRYVEDEFRLATHGWAVATTVAANTVVERYRDEGLRHVLVTDIDRDGALSGPNLELYRQLASAFPDIEVQASGGIRDMADLQALADTGAAAAISGKALLEGRLAQAEIEPYLRSA